MEKENGGKMNKPWMIDGFIKKKNKLPKDDIEKDFQSYMDIAIQDEVNRTNRKLVVEWCTTFNIIDDLHDRWRNDYPGIEEGEAEGIVISQCVLEFNAEMRKYAPYSNKAKNFIQRK
jgi:hypothetical protein